jgi:hypothetical protein
MSLTVLGILFFYGCGLVRIDVSWRQNWISWVRIGQIASDVVGGFLVGTVSTSFRGGRLLLMIGMLAAVWFDSIRGLNQICGSCAGAIGWRCASFTVYILRRFLGFFVSFPCWGWVQLISHESLLVVECMAWYGWWEGHPFLFMCLAMMSFLLVLARSDSKKESF